MRKALWKAAAFGNHRLRACYLSPGEDAAGMRWPVTKKMLLVMKMLSFLLMAGCLQLSAAGFSQGVSISEKNASLETVFKEIRKQTGYEFIYSSQLLAKAKKVDIKVKNGTLEQVLEICFKDQPFSYTIIDKTIVVKPKEGGGPNDEEIASLRSQLVDVKGRVVNEAGEPVEGASVMVKGTKMGTTTNANGEFQLSGIDENAVLVISGVSIETSEIKVDGRTNLVVAVKTEITSLQEVVINKGYYTERQKFSVSNVGKVTAKDIEKQPVSNPLLAIQGRVPGLFITQSSGVPGSGVTVRIQGESSISGSVGKDPLYVIDGVPYASQLLPNLGNIQGTSGGPIIGGVPTGSGNPLNYISPNDIESIEVLKDADATAIYGSRAANGAILITTKKGKAGQIRVNANVQVGQGKVTRMLDLMNTQQYLQMRREAKLNDGASIDASDYDINGFWDTTRYTNWQKELIGGTAKYTDAQVSVSGGSLQTQFLIGTTYHKETSVFPGDFFDRKGSVHFNVVTTSQNQKFRIQLNGNYMVDDNRLFQSDLTSSVLLLAPNAPALYNTDGSLNWMQNSSGTSTFTNPLRDIYTAYNNNTTNLISSAIFSYRILENLELKGSFGYNNLRVNDYNSFPLIAIQPEDRPNSSRSAQYSNSEVKTWIVEPQLSYKKEIWKGDFEMLVGTTIQQNNSAFQQYTGEGYISDEVLKDIRSASTITVDNTANSEYRYNALFGRINYVAASKYIVNLTARRDGSSRFGRKSQFNNFGAAGLGWIFSKEKVITKSLPFMSFGKLRASYGTTGNDQIGDYQYLNLYRPITAGVSYQGTNSLEVRGLANPYLEWEEVRKLQIGIDLGFINDRITASATFVKNRSSNQLLPYGLPFVTGFGSLPSINFPATFQNISWEFSLASTNFKTKDFIWSSSFNLTVPKNKLLSFPNLETSTYNNRLIIGQPVSIIKVFKFAGVNPTTGVYQFVDSQGNLTSTPDASKDQTVIINTSPKFYGGVQNSFSFRGIGLDFFFQFVKQVGNNYFFGSVFPPGFFGFNQPVTLLDRWHKPGDVASIQKVSSNFSLFTAGGNARRSDAAYTDASYARLKNVSLSWQLPERLKKKLHLQSSKVYVNGQNLLTFTKYKGMDPENRSTIGLPPLKVVTVGLQIGL